MSRNVIIGALVVAAAVAVCVWYMRKQQAA